MSGTGKRYGTGPSPLRSSLQIPQLTQNLTRLDSKDNWRAAILAERAAVSPSTSAQEAHALAEHVAAAFTVAAGADPQNATVAIYVPSKAEPGSVEMLDALAALGPRVLLPVTAPGNTLDWGEYHPDFPLAAARYGLLEPTGPRLGADALAQADAIFVPALAVDHRGVRLGRGAGYYDRALGAAALRCPVYAIVRDCEFVPGLPESAHDRRVDGVVTPEVGLTLIGDGDFRE